MSEIKVRPTNKPPMKYDWQWNMNSVTVNNIPAEMWWNNARGVRSYLKFENEWYIAVGDGLDYDREFTCERLNKL